MSQHNSHCRIFVLAYAHHKVLSFLVMLTQSHTHIDKHSWRVILPGMGMAVTPPVRPSSDLPSKQRSPFQ